MSNLTPEQRHQQAVFRQIRLPIGAGMAFLMLTVLGLFLFSLRGDVSYQQIHCLTGGLMIVCIFLPLVILMFVFNFIMLVVALKAGDLYGLLRPPLITARQYAEQGATTTQHLAEQVTAPVIRARTKISYWRHIALSLFPEEKNANEK